jgi:hypothetical protein
MVMSQDQNVGWNHITKISNKPIERVEQFRYLGTTLRNQGFIYGEIKSRECLLTFSAESFVFHFAAQKN